MPKLSQRILNLKGSPTLELVAKASELKAQGKDVISLGAGEPLWDTFSPIKDAGISAIKEGFVRYTSSLGMPELRERIAKWSEKTLKVPVSSQEVTVTAGAKFVIFAALQSLIDPECEVIIPAPYWVSYPSMVELCGGVPLVVKGSSLKLSPKDLKNSITSNTKALILNSPCNPSGEIYSHAELRALADVLKDHPQVWVISDDIYSQLMLSKKEVAPHILHVAPELKPQTLCVNGVSKTYGMTGWRLGFGVGPDKLISAMGRYQSQTVTCASAISQKAALKALELDQSKGLQSELEKLGNSLKLCQSKVDGISGLKCHPPKAGFYLWVDVRGVLPLKSKKGLLSSSQDLALGLLEEKNVVVIPGEAFGYPGFWRVSCPSDSKLILESFKRIGDFLKSN